MAIKILFSSSSLILLGFILSVTSFKLPEFGKGFDMQQFPEELKKNLEQFGKFTNDSMDHVTKMLDKFKIDFIPNLNEMQRNSTNSCVQFAKNMARKITPAFYECLKKIPGDMMDKARSKRGVLPDCFGKCVTMKLNILNDDGTPNIVNAKAFIDDIVPPMFSDFVMQIMEKCQDKVLAIKADDAKCETHRAAMKCIKNGASEVSMEALKRCPDIPEGWKKLIESVSDNTKAIDA